MVEPFELLRDLRVAVCEDRWAKVMPDRETPWAPRPFPSNQGRWSPTVKCSCGLRAPALLPERLALDSLEGASLDLALALARQRGCGRGLDGGGLRCRGLRCRLGYRPLLQSDDFRFGHTL